MFTVGSENLFYLTYGMPQSRTSRRADLNVIVGKEGKVKGEYGPPDANGNRQLQYDDNRSAGIFIFNRKGEPITKISQGTADDIATNKRGKNGKKYEKAKANKGQ